MGKTWLSDDALRNEVRVCDGHNANFTILAKFGEKKHIAYAKSRIPRSIFSIKQHNHVLPRDTFSCIYIITKLVLNVMYGEILVP